LNNCLSFPCLGIGLVDFQHGALGHYLGSTAQSRQTLMNCPSDLGDIREVKTGGPTPSMQNRNFSYSFNCWLRGPNSSNGGLFGFSGMRAPQIVHPSSKVLVFEEQWPNDLACEMVNWNGTNTDDVPSLRHNGRCNMGFADGHVDALFPADFGVVMRQAGSSGASGVYFLPDPKNRSDPYDITEQYCDLLKP
jgi:prepilin-type processing-associated H-X9-DG protein